MSATVQCKACGRIAHACIIEDDHTTNSMVLEDNINWRDADQELPVLMTSTIS